MKAYGYSRAAKSNCKYGCCDRLDAGKHRNARPLNDRARRKAARQTGRVGIFTSLLE